MANGKPKARSGAGSTSRAIKFKRGFRPRRAEIAGEDGAVYVFETARVTRTIERELQDAFERIADETNAGTEDAQFNVIGALLDKLIVPAEDNQKQASEVLRGMWESDEIEFADVLDYLERISSERRPT